MEMSLANPAIMLPNLWVTCSDLPPYLINKVRKNWNVFLFGSNHLFLLF